MDEFDKEVLEESTKIIENFDPEVIKEDADSDWVSVLIKDKNSDFQAWMDFNFMSEECDWNKFVFFNNNSKDMIEKKVMDDNNVFDLCSSLACSAAIKHRKTLRINKENI